MNGEGAFAVNQVEGDYVVRYEGAAFTRLSGDQVNQERSRILKYWGEFLDEKEEGVVADGFDAKVGLVARSFLRADAKDLKVTKILKAKSEETGEN